MTVLAPAREVAFAGGEKRAFRPLAVEAPVAFEFNGIGYAVMMATPSDLEDFATGLSLSEGLIGAANHIEAIDVHGAEGGMIVRVTLPPRALEPVLARARRRVSESSCGLCGMDNIAEVLRPLPPVTARMSTTRAAIAAALEALAAHQPLSRETGAVHAAAFCTPDGRIVLAREDVGRHNALDKVIGALARAEISAADGFILITSRCSYEMVEKTARANCPLLVAISAPTNLAVARARDAGLALVALARSDTMLVLVDPNGVVA
jgi:FdhD protein